MWLFILSRKSHVFPVLVVASFFLHFMHFSQYRTLRELQSILFLMCHIVPLEVRKESPGWMYNWHSLHFGPPHLKSPASLLVSFLLVLGDCWVVEKAAFVSCRSRFLGCLYACMNVQLLKTFWMRSVRGKWKRLLICWRVFLWLKLSVYVVVKTSLFRGSSCGEGGGAGPCSLALWNFLSTPIWVSHQVPISQQLKTFCLKFSLQNRRN